MIDQHNSRTHIVPAHFSPAPGLVRSDTHESPKKTKQLPPTRTHVRRMMTINPATCYIANIVPTMPNAQVTTAVPAPTPFPTPRAPLAPGGDPSVPAVVGAEVSSPLEPSFPSSATVGAIDISSPSNIAAGAGVSDVPASASPASTVDVGAGVNPLAPSPMVAESVVHEMVLWRDWVGGEREVVWGLQENNTHALSGA